MSQQHFNPGSLPDGVGGDTNRTVNEKWESNFSELYTFVGNVPSTYVTRSYQGDWITATSTLAVRIVNSSSDTQRWTAPYDYSCIVSIPTYNGSAGMALSSSTDGSNRFYMRGKDQGLSGDPWQRWKPWAELWTTGNTTVDSNNFIKRA